MVPGERIAKQRSRTKRLRKDELAKDKVRGKGYWESIFEGDRLRRTGLGLDQTKM